MNRASGWLGLSVALVALNWGCAPRASPSHRAGLDEKPDPRETVTVKTVRDLVRAIAPNRVILIQPGNYLITEEDRKTHTRFVSWGGTNENDEASLVITNVWNLKIVGLGKRAVGLVSDTTNGYVVFLRYCSRIELVNLEIGHKPGAGRCDYGVLHIEEGNNISISQCVLFGSGSVGMSVRKSKKIVLSRSHIRKCTRSIAVATLSEDIALTDCTFTENRGGFYLDSKAVRIVNCRVENNLAYQEMKERGGLEQKAYDVLFSAGARGHITVRNSTIRDNEAGLLAAPKGRVIFIDSRISRNKIAGWVPK